MTQPASLLPLDPSPPRKMPKSADGKAGEFRLMIDHPGKAGPADILKGHGRLAKDERAADDRIGLRVHSGPKLAAIDEEAATAIRQADVAQDEPVEDERDGSREEALGEGDEPAGAVLPSLQVIEELRKLLGAGTGEGAAGTVDEKAGPAGATEANEAEPGAQIRARAAAVAPGSADGVPVEHRARAAAPLDKPATRAADNGEPPARNTSTAAADDAPVAAARATGREQASSDDAAGRQGSRGGRQDGKPMQGVAVVADAPATPQPAAQPATRTVVAALGADPAWAAYFRAKPEPAAQPPHALTIQLRPAELGVVTAHLRFAGERVAVELQAETAEAHRQLSGDTDMIARSLRAAGIEVDQVTVQPAPQAQDSGRGALAGRGGETAGGGAFASPDNSGERGGRQSGSGAQTFQTGRGSDETRSGAGGADRDGRYI